MSWRWAIALVVVAPLLVLLVTGQGRAAFAEVDWRTLAPITWNTFLYAATVTLAAGALGPPLAWLVSRAEFLGRRWLREAWLFPAAIPPVLLAVGSFDLWSERGGLLAGVLPGAWITGLVGMSVVSTAAFLPWVIAPVAAALERSDPALEEAARMSGASAFRAFLDVGWPLARAEWLASLGLVFAATAASFGVPYFLGSLAEARVGTLTTEMVQVLSLSSDHGIGRALIVGLPLVALSLLASGVSLLFKKKGGGDLARAAQALRLPLSGVWRLAPALGWLGFGAGIVLPIVALAARATASQAAAPLTSARSAAAFARLFSHADAGRIFLTSIGLATVSAAAITVIGACWALGRRRHANARRAIAAVYALPGTLVALGWVSVAALQVRAVILDRVTVTLALQNTFWLLALGYVSKYLIVGIDSAAAAFGRVGPTLVEAARLSGASPGRAARDVVVPLSWPALAATFALLWVTLFPELTLSVLLFGPTTATLGTWLFDLSTYTDPAQGSALALTIVAISVGLRLVAGSRNGVSNA